MPIFVSSLGVWRHSAESPKNFGVKSNHVVGSGGGSCDDVEDDDIDDGTSTVSEQPSEVVCHPVSIPVNFNTGLVPVVCGCLPASESKESDAYRRWMRLNLATASSVADVSYPVNVSKSALTSFPSAPVLLQRL